MAYMYLRYQSMAGQLIERNISIPEKSENVEGYALIDYRVVVLCNGIGQVSLVRVCGCVCVW